MGIKNFLRFLLCLIVTLSLVACNTAVSSVPSTSNSGTKTDTEQPPADNPDTEVSGTDQDTEVPSTDEPVADDPATEVPSADVPVTDDPATEIPPTEEEPDTWYTLTDASVLNGTYRGEYYPQSPEEYGIYILELVCPYNDGGKIPNGVKIDKILDLETLVYKNASEKGITEDQAWAEIKSMYKYYSETGNYGLILSRETLIDGEAFLSCLSSGGSGIKVHSSGNKLQYTENGSTVYLYRQQNITENKTVKKQTRTAAEKLPFFVYQKHFSTALSKKSGFFLSGGGAA